MQETAVSLVFLAAIAVLAPILAALVRRALLVPLIVFEIGLGLLVGPNGLGWVADSPVLELLSTLGLAMLFFMAGNEIAPAALTGRPAGRAVGGWVISLTIAVAAGIAIGQDVAATAVIAIALTGTALGTIMPILRDSGLGKGPLGAVIIPFGAIGEFAPLIAISILLSGRTPLAGTIVLLIFVVISGVAVWLTISGPSNWLHHLVRSTMRTSGQFAVRFVVLVLAALVAVAVLLGIDFLLGAFVAGMLARLALRGGDPEDLEVIEAKLESLAFGFFVPIFFIMTGVTFPLATLLSDQTALLLVPIFAALMLLARGLPAFLLAGRGTSFSDRRTAALFSATTLPLVIAVTSIGVEEGLLDPSIAAAMVGGGMITVLLFPMLALLGRPRALAGDQSAPVRIDAHE
jgi:Kef-type K+ transport system membrane component KefB